MRFDRAVLAYRGKLDVDPESFEDAADMLCGLSALHGLTLDARRKSCPLLQELEFSKVLGNALPVIYSWAVGYSGAGIL
jgi:hypothetical protein